MLEIQRLQDSIFHQGYEDPLSGHLRILVHPLQIPPTLSKHIRTGDRKSTQIGNFARQNPCGFGERHVLMQEAQNEYGCAIKSAKSVSKVWPEFRIIINPR